SSFATSGSRLTSRLSDWSSDACSADLSGAASGSFSYTASEGQGTYSFYTRATDTAGNLEAAPVSPDFQVQVLYDTTAPVTTDDRSEERRGGNDERTHSPSDTGTGSADA